MTSSRSRTTWRTASWSARRSALGFWICSETLRVHCGERPGEPETTPSPAQKTQRCLVRGQTYPFLQAVRGSPRQRPELTLSLPLALGVTPQRACGPWWSCLQAAPGQDCGDWLSTGGAGGCGSHLFLFSWPFLRRARIFARKNS